MASSGSSSSNNSSNNNNNSNNGNSSSSNTTVTVEHSETSTVMPRAHGINQVTNSSSPSSSDSGFFPRGNSASPMNNLNNSNNAALGQKRMSNDDLKKSGLDDDKRKNLNKEKDKDSNNSKNDNDGKNNSNNDIDPKKNPEQKDDNDSDDDSDRNSMPSANPNTNSNARAADLGNARNNPRELKNIDDNRQNIPKPKENPTSSSNRNVLKKGIPNLEKYSPKNIVNNLKDMWKTKEGKIKIITRASFVFIGFLALALFVVFLTSLFTSLQNSMCDDSNSLVYSGSGNVTEFMCRMQSPLGDKTYTISSPAGEARSYETHPGIDLAMPGGTPIYAVQSGKVVRAGVFGGYGNCVDIEHGGGIVTRYGHMQDGSIKVSVGDTINRGARIGSVGSTGQSTGNHLHFEIILNGKPVYDQNAYFDYRGTGGYETRNVSKTFLKSCGSSAGASYVSTSTVATTTDDVKSYKSVKVLKKLSKSTGTIKHMQPKSGFAFQSFAYNSGYFYLQMIHRGRFGSGGYIYKYDSNLKKVDQSRVEQPLFHGNGLAYSTADNRLYSASTKYVGNNTHTRILNSKNLKVVDKKKLLKHAAAIGYDRITNRFVTGLAIQDVYVYNSNLSDYAGAKHITKIRSGGSPGDVAAYGGIVYITIWQAVGNNHIDMYNEDTGEYLGSYEAPYDEIEGIDIDDSGQIVLLFHAGSPFLQFTGIKAKVINNSDDSSVTAGGGSQCCTDSSPSYTTDSGSQYCTDGITVTGKNAGTYSIDEYVERVVTAENGGAHDEALKALAIAARTYAINRTDNCTKTIPNSTAAQVMADKASDKVVNALQSVKGSIMLYNGKYFSAEYSSFLGTCNSSTCTSTFVKVPSKEKATFTMPKSYLSINAGHERGLSQNGSNYMAHQGKTYREILEFFYADGIQITGSSGSSNSCSLGASGTYNSGKVWDYNQANYSDPYCGGTIADSGCGPTAMAMVVSTLLSEAHDPPELAKASSVCSTEKHQYFIDAAKKYGLKAVTTTDHDEVMTALNRGDTLVIANVTNATVDGQKNFWTEHGHYIVLAGHSGRDVWVQDPNKGMPSVHRSNTKGDGVYNFDKYVKPAATIGYIIIKKA